MLPSWLLWLLPLPVATLAALSYGAWAGRVRGPARPQETVAEHERFRRALAAPLPPTVTGQPARDRRPTRTTTRTTTGRPRPPRR